MTRERTQSLCPVCLRRLDAVRETDKGNVYLVKTCPDHGPFRTVVWRGEPDAASWRRPKIPSPPRNPFQPVDRGCPFDCGLCPAHRQRTCAVLFEITRRCDLGCPVCFARSGTTPSADPSLEILGQWFQAAARLSPGALVQLTGGEPTLRNDLPAVVRLAIGAGFPFVQLNTNGLRLAWDETLARDLKRAGLDTVFLQFDGAQSGIYEKLRGRDLLAEKMKAIDVCGRAGLGVVLVPTLAPGVNDHNVGDILRLAVRLGPAVRAVHFQPVTYLGRYPQSPADRDRLTLPELIRAMETQTGGDFPARAFGPPGCENALCSFHGRFFIDRASGRVLPLSAEAGTCCPPPERAEEGAARTMARVTRDWAAAPRAPEPPAARTDPESAAEPPGSGPEPRRTGSLISLDEFLQAARSRTLSVSAMAFQDAWTLDLDRLRDCCIHVFSPDRGLTPFCAWYLTSMDGRRLYPC